MFTMTDQNHQTNDNTTTLAGASCCRLKIFFRDPPFMNSFFMKLWCSPSNINFNEKKYFFPYWSSNIIQLFSTY